MTGLSLPALSTRSSWSLLSAKARLAGSVTLKMTRVAWVSRSVVSPSRKMISVSTSSSMMQTLGWWELSPGS